MDEWTVRMNGGGKPGFHKVIHADNALEAEGIAAEYATMFAFVKVQFNGQPWMNGGHQSRSARGIGTIPKVRRAAAAGA